MVTQQHPSMLFSSGSQPCLHNGVARKLEKKKHQDQGTYVKQPGHGLRPHSHGGSSEAPELTRTCSRTGRQLIGEAGVSEVSTFLNPPWEFRLVTSPLLVLFPHSSQLILGIFTQGILSKSLFDWKQVPTPTTTADMRQCLETFLFAPNHGNSTTEIKIQMPGRP